MQNIKRNELLAWQTLGDNIVILDSRGKKEIHELNLVASFLWNLCDGQRNAQDLALALHQEFEISLEEAQNDVHSFLELLSNKALLQS